MHKLLWMSIITLLNMAFLEVRMGQKEVEDGAYFRVGEDIHGSLLSHVERTVN